MSYWVYLKDSHDNPVEVEHFSEGGTQILGGSYVAEMNVTYNYSGLFAKYLHPHGLRWLDNQKAKDVLPAMINAVDQLGTMQDYDYWNPTPGNAGFALAVLIRWAQSNPEAKFRVH